MATQRNGWLWCALAAVLFGAATPVTALLVGNLGAVALAGLLYLGAAFAVAPFVRRAPAPPRPRSQWSRLAVAVTVGGGLAPVLLVLALERTPAGQVSLFLNLELVATAVIARVFLREHLGHRAAGGISLIVIAGAALAGTADAGVAAGALLVTMACLCWGVDNAITASLDGFSPAQITMAKGLAAGSVNLVVGAWLAGVPPIGSVAAGLAIGAVSYGLSITMWITGARLVGAARGQAIFALAPFVGAALAGPVNGEPLGGRTVMAFAMSLVGVAVIGSGQHAHLHGHRGIEHTHPIDPIDPHHGAGAIELVGGEQHRHLPLVHEHEHVPNIHHRHSH
jgi:drug/metabolite transporter (DMT)-like permease